VPYSKGVYILESTPEAGGILYVSVTDYGVADRLRICPGIYVNILPAAEIGSLAVIPVTVGPNTGN